MVGIVIRVFNGGGEQRVSLYRTSLLVCLFVLASSFPLAAHRAEPISTEFALPFQPKAGTVKVIYEYEREGDGASQHTLPEIELELGIAPRVQVNLGYSLFRIKEGRDDSAALVGGKLEVGARYLLFGGGTRSYAVSLQGTVEAPTGNRQLLGDATELGAGLFVDRYLGERVRFHSNLAWKTTVGGRHETERLFEYNNALVWLASLRWIPAVEALGTTNTVTGQTELAVQPEMIFYAGPHLELKVGVPVGLTAISPRIGVRAQIAILWGGPR